jgi:hypothetical protein
VLAALGGCAPPAPVAPVKRVETPQERHARDGERIAADPVGFLREVNRNVASLQQYRLTFYRQERTGLPPQLGPMERMRVAFRQTPFSVKLDWDDENMPYYESVYMEGQNRNQVVVRERKGALPFLPRMVRSVDIMLPVKLGKSKNPITDFGLKRMVQRTLLPFDNPEVAKVMTIQYKGLIVLEPINRTVHYIRIDRPRMEGFQYTHQDVYFDAETLLPAGTDLYLPNDVLDVRYRYTDVNTDVRLTDADFRLSKDHPAEATKPATAK